MLLLMLLPGCNFQNPPANSSIEQIGFTSTQNDCPHHNLSPFLKTDPAFGTDGVFDTTYHRIQFHFSKVERNPEDSCSYLISGANRLKGLVTTFNGVITIKRIIVHPGNIYQPEKPSEDQLVDYFGTYYLAEEKNLNGSGEFTGSFHCQLTLRQNLLFDDLIEYMGDGFSNFIFQGTWKSYNSQDVKKCIWGQGRLPDTNDFNQGDGDRVVNNKYQHNGWDSDDSGNFLDNPKEWWNI